MEVARRSSTDLVTVLFTGSDKGKIRDRVSAVLHLFSRNSVPRRGSLWRGRALLSAFDPSSALGAPIDLKSSLLPYVRCVIRLLPLSIRERPTCVRARRVRVRLIRCRCGLFRNQEFGPSPALEARPLPDRERLGFGSRPFFHRPNASTITLCSSAIDTGFRSEMFAPAACAALLSSGVLCPDITMIGVVADFARM